MNYTLKHKDMNIAVFTTRDNPGKEVSQCIFDKHLTDELPLPLKRLVKAGYKEEFIEYETDDIYRLNEDGCYLFDNWLSDREIPLNRFNYNLYIDKNTTAREWLLNNNGYSFTDCYWFESEEEKLCFSDIQAKKDTLDSFYLVKNEKNHYKPHTASLGGQLEKFWFKKNDEVYLCKKVKQNDDILAVREFIASEIYKQQNCHNFCDYKLVMDKTNQVLGCICKNFVQEDQELISVYDLLEEYNLTQNDNVWNLIIEKANEYGLDKQSAKDFLDIQILVDFLITNRDRHENNIGFIRDASTKQILKPAPIYDNGSSKQMESMSPETLYGTTVNGLYHTELECLKHVNNFNILDMNKLPTTEEYAKMINLCKSLTEQRKSFMIKRYDEKTKFLKELQIEYNKDTNMENYIQNIINRENHKCEEQRLDDDMIQIFDDNFLL